MTYDSSPINNIGGSVGNSNISSIFAKASVCSGDGLVKVGNKGNIHSSESTLISSLKGVLHMGELGVNGNSDNFASDFSELLGLIVEGNDLSGADEGEVKWVEEQDYVFTMVGSDVDVNEVSVEPGRGDESWGRFSDQ